MIRYDPQDTHRSDIDLWPQEIIVRGGAGKPGRPLRCAEQDDLTCRLAELAMAGYGREWLGSRGRWLPVRLPGIVSKSNARMPGP